VQQRVSKDKYYQFLWRPRPPSLLTPAQEKEIRRKLPEYSAKYLEEDRSQPSTLNPKPYTQLGQVSTYMRTGLKLSKVLYTVTFIH